MADPLQTARHHRGNSRGCFCSLATELSTPKVFNNSATRFVYSDAINVVRVRQGIRRRRAPIEEWQDTGSCAHPSRFDQRADRFSSDEAYADVPTARPM